MAVLGAVPTSREFEPVELEALLTVVAPTAGDLSLLSLAKFPTLESLPLPGCQWTRLVEPYPPPPLAGPKFAMYSTTSPAPAAPAVQQRQLAAASFVAPAPAKSATSRAYHVIVCTRAQHVIGY